MGNDRLSDIESWWSVATQSAMVGWDEVTKDRIWRAFREVLIHLPEADFVKFMACAPYIISPQNASACMGAVKLPVPPAATEVECWMIYIHEDAQKWRDEHMRNVLAHEIAHIVLRHALPSECGPSQTDLEADADRLSQSWGFRPMYTSDGLI